MVQNTSRALADLWVKNRDIVSNLSGELKEQNEKAQKQAVGLKLDLGGKLTNYDKLYLKSKEPERYNIVQQMEREQRLFEQKLRKCKTKTERKQLMFHKTMSVLSGANLNRRATNGLDSNYTLPRLNHLREGERKVRFSTWA